MQLALYRAERPEVFEDIIGQKQIVRILQNQIKTGTVSQAYLFAGTHGTGKTTTARILAKAVNCLEAESTDTANGPAGKLGEAASNPAENGGEAADDRADAPSIPCGKCANCEAIREGKFVDVIELDAASNNRVEDLRAIIDLVKYPPTIGKYKVFIIDEVHMLTQQAENAFLKTLEEPPEYAIFILATTDPEKVRPTIRSRCMELNFKRVNEEELVAGMQRICEKRGVQATRDALGTIASKGDGSVRDALSILEQCMAAGDSQLDKNMVLEYTGSAGEDFYLALTGAVEGGDLGKALLYIDEIIKRGKDAKQILKDWLEHYRNLMIVKYVGKAERVLSASAENIARLRAQAETVDIRSIERAIRLISEYINIGRYSDRPRILLETVAVRLVAGGEASPSEIGTKPNVARAAAKAAKAAGRSANASDRAEFAPSGQPGAGSLGAIRAAAREDAAPGSLGAIRAAAEEDEEPLTSIAPLPREEAGEPDDMWNRIVAEISRQEPSFGVMVGKNSIGEKYSGGELTVRVKKNKLSLAEDKNHEILEMAKKIYGSDTFVTLKGGDITAVEPRAEVQTAGETETAELMNADEKMAELTEDISNFFGGMSVEVVD